MCLNIFPYVQAGIWIPYLCYKCLVLKDLCFPETKGHRITSDIDMKSDIIQVPHGFLYVVLIQALNGQFIVVYFSFNSSQQCWLSNVQYFPSALNHLNHPQSPLSIKHNHFQVQIIYFF